MNARRRSLTAWLFLAPALLFLATFTFYPILCGVVLAFFDFNLLRHTPEGALGPPRFVGVENFERVLHDRYFWIALKNSLLYLLVVPILLFQFLRRRGLPAAVAG